MFTHTCSCGAEYASKRKYKWRCQPCANEYAKALYASKTQEQKVQTQAREKLRKVKLAQYVYDYLKVHPCSCGESRVACLQFDHLRDKQFNVSEMAQAGIALNKIKDEIAKCRVLCANCHAAHTAEQFNWYSKLDK